MMLTLGSNLRLWTGRFAESVQYGERALAGFRKLGDRFGAIQALAPLNRARVALGRLGDAERGAEELLALSDSFGEMAYPAIAAAGVAMHSGQGERTVELAGDAVDRIASTGANVDEGLVLLSMGLSLSGKPEDALVTLLDVDVAVLPVRARLARPRQRDGRRQQGRDRRCRRARRRRRDELLRPHPGHRGGRRGGVGGVARRRGGAAGARADVDRPL